MQAAFAIRAKLRDPNTLAEPWGRPRQDFDTGRYVVIEGTGGDVTVYRDVGAPVPDNGHVLGIGQARDLIRALLEKYPQGRLLIAPTDAQRLRVSAEFNERGLRQGVATGRARSAVRRPSAVPATMSRPGRVPREPRNPREARVPRLPREARTPRAGRFPRRSRRPRPPRDPRPARPPRPPRMAGMKNAGRRPYCVSTWQPHLEQVATAGCEWFEQEAHRTQAQLNPRSYVVPAAKPGCGGCLSSECTGPLAPLLKKILGALGVQPPPPLVAATAGRTRTERFQRKIDQARRASITEKAPPPVPHVEGAVRIALWVRSPELGRITFGGSPYTVLASEGADINGLYGQGGTFTYSIRCYYGDAECR